MALASVSTLFFMAANTAAPGVGGVAAAATIAALLRPRPERPDVVAAVAEEVARPGATPKAGATPEAAWRDWLPWAELAAGQKIEVPRGLPHPKEAGFRFTRWGRGVGQTADWVHPLPDHSRLHAHEFADGRLVVHRDRLDPGRGPAVATIHWLSECPEGNVLLGVLFAAQVGALAWVLVGARRSGVTSSPTSSVPPAQATSETMALASTSFR